MDGKKRNPEAVAEAIRKARTIAVVSHVNPDGDTIGCATAMRLGLLARTCSGTREKAKDRLT